MEYNKCRDCNTVFSDQDVRCPRCGRFDYSVIEIKENHPTECAFCRCYHYKEGYLCENCEEQHEPHSLDKIYWLLDEKEGLEIRADKADRLESRNKYLENGMKVLTLEHTKRPNEVEELTKEGKQLQGKLAEIEVTQKAIDEGFRKFKIGKMVELELLRESNGILILDHTKLLEENKELKKDKDELLKEFVKLKEEKYFEVQTLLKQLADLKIRMLEICP